MLQLAISSFLNIAYFFTIDWCCKKLWEERKLSEFVENMEQNFYFAKFWPIKFERESFTVNSFTHLFIRSCIWKESQLMNKFLTLPLLQNWIPELENFFKTCSQFLPSSSVKIFPVHLFKLRRENLCP